MSDKKGAAAAGAGDEDVARDVPLTGDEDEDTEGHVLPINPTVADMLDRDRAAQTDRDARIRIFRRDARDQPRRKR